MPENISRDPTAAVVRSQGNHLELNWYERPFFRKKILPWIFIAPITILYIMVVIGPSISAIGYSLTDWSGIGEAEYIGLENFRKLIFEDQNFRLAFKNNLIWMIFFLTIPFAMALVASSMLARIKRGAMFFRTAIFIPYILPSVITVAIWQNLMSPRRGIGAQLNRSFGIETFNRAYLGNPDTALLSIAFIDNWHFWVFLVIIFLTAMQSISTDLYDAAKIDGANRFHEFRYVTLPGVLPTLVFMIMMVAIWSFLVFDYVWLTTQGGPAGATEVLGTFLYKEAFRRFEAGYASAVGLTISFFASMIMGFVVILRRRGVEI
ncbi:MAG: raffinose/stachyose/melibiose transport system permease protein [Cellvibrionaceae bacterium]|jgi:raffinose/stachyose/melibiose transport system permease protein